MKVTLQHQDRFLRGILEKLPDQPPVDPEPDVSPLLEKLPAPLVRPPVVADGPPEGAQRPAGREDKRDPRIGAAKGAERPGRERVLQRRLGVKGGGRRPEVHRQETPLPRPEGEKPVRPGTLSSMEDRDKREGRVHLLGGPSAHGAREVLGRARREVPTEPASVVLVPRPARLGAPLLTPEKVPDHGILAPRGVHFQGPRFAGPERTSAAEWVRAPCAARRLVEDVLPPAPVASRKFASHRRAAGPTPRPLRAPRPARPPYLRHLTRK